jgi:hypothetical protein
MFSGAGLRHPKPCIVSFACMSKVLLLLAEVNQAGMFEISLTLCTPAGCSCQNQQHTFQVASACSAGPLSEQAHTEGTSHETANPVPSAVQLAPVLTPKISFSKCRRQDVVDMALEAGFPAREVACMTVHELKVKLKYRGPARAMESSRVEIAVEPPASKSCPLCTSPMVSRRNSGTYTDFWGCSLFPDCRGTRSAS